MVFSILYQLCRFFNSLIKLNVVDPTADTDSAAMAHFALNHSRFEEANQLYRVLVSKNCVMMYELPDVEGMRSVTSALTVYVPIDDRSELGRKRYSGRLRLVCGHIRPLPA